MILKTIIYFCVSMVSVVHELRQCTAGMACLCLMSSAVLSWEDLNVGDWNYVNYNLSHFWWLMQVWLEAWLWLSERNPHVASSLGFMFLVTWCLGSKRDRDREKELYFSSSLTLEVVEHHFCSTLFQAGISFLKFKRKEHRSDRKC